MGDAPDLSIPRWRDESWLRDARGWIEASLSEAGTPVIGEAEQIRSMPWSTLLRVITGAGVVWFKANAAGVAHEAALLAVLARRCPEHVLAPVAVDTARGWLLLPDGGPTLRDVQGASTDLGAWERMLGAYAAMQRSLEPHVEELLVAGTPDRRPERLPAVLEALLSDPGLLMRGHAKGLTDQQYADQRSASPGFGAMCRDLAEIGIPSTLQHDDLHDNNVFAPARPGGSMRVFDWGDSAVAHPFGTLLVSLRVVADRTGLPYGSAELLRLRDAYLEPWTSAYDRPTLVEACRLALRVGPVLRADCYRRALLEATPVGREEFGDGVPAWLGELFEPTPVEAVG